MGGVVTSKTDWYLMRGSGLVALVLLSAAVALGVLESRRWRASYWPRALTSGLHRNVALLATCFLGLHVLTAVLDSWIGLAWIDAVVPFASRYQPGWIGLGAVAIDLVVAVVATSLLRRHLPHAAWRGVHWLAWLAWPVAVLHSLGAGSDTRSGWGLLVVVGCMAVVATALCWRVLPRRPRPDLRIPPTPSQRAPTFATVPVRETTPQVAGQPAPGDTAGRR